MATASIPSQIYRPRHRRLGIFRSVARFFGERRSREENIETSPYAARWCDATERAINDQILFGRNYSKL